MPNNIATPRVNTSTIRNYTGTIVRIVGEAKSETTLRTQDGEVNIHRSPGSSFQQNTYYEVVGEVNQDGSVSENFVYDWGTNFDLEVYNNMLAVYQKFSNEIFV